MTNRRRTVAIAACAIAGGLLGLAACLAFPQRYTSTVELWFFGGRRARGPVNTLVLRTVREVCGRGFVYPSYDLQRIPVQSTDRNREKGRKTAGNLMTAAIAAADRIRSDEPAYAGLWLEQAEAPSLTAVQAGEYTWTGLLRVHAPVPLRLDHAILGEELRSVKSRIVSERFLQTVISGLPRYRLEVNSDVTAMKRYVAVLRRNLHFKNTPQDDVLRIWYTCDDPKLAKDVLNRIVNLAGDQSKFAKGENVAEDAANAENGGKPLLAGVSKTHADQMAQSVRPFDVAEPASVPDSADKAGYWSLMMAGLGVGLMLGVVFVGPKKE